MLSACEHMRVHSRAHTPALYPSHSQCWETSMKQLLSYTVETQYAGFHAHQKFRSFKDLWECFPVRHHESLRRTRLPGNWHPSCWKQPFLGIPSLRAPSAAGGGLRLWEMLHLCLLSHSSTHTRAHTNTHAQTASMRQWEVPLSLSLWLLEVSHCKDGFHEGLCSPAPAVCIVHIQSSCS